MRKKVPPVVLLAQAVHLPPEEIGHKAKRLAQMMAEGFPVPEGFVVTDRAFRDFCAFNGIDPGAEPEEIVRGLFPTALQEVIAECLDKNTAWPAFAVRSSSGAEDGLDFSMAGQFETLLDVSREEVLKAIKVCWSSRFGQPVKAYLSRKSICDAPMGVIVQRQIQAEYAGVIFTLDPIRRTTDHLVLEWVPGMGESLVSGKATPERLHLRRGSQNPTDTLPRRLAMHVESLKNHALDAERRFGRPIDMEWCCDREGLHVLQARPITGIGGNDTMAWTNANMAENFPHPLTPFAWSAVDAFYSAYMRCALKLFGWTDPELSQVEDILTTLNGVHCGRIYYNLGSWYEVMHLFPIGRWLRRSLDTYIGQKAIMPFQSSGLDKVQPPLKRMANLALFWPRLAAAVGNTTKRIEDFEQLFYRRRALWRDEGEDTAWRQFQELKDVFRFVEEHWAPAICADLKVMLTAGLLESLIRLWISEDADPVMASLMQGVDVKSTEPARLIWSMAQAIGKDERLAGLLKLGNYQELERSLEEEPRALLDTFMEDFGGRCYHDCMIVYPTFEERHDLFWDLVRSYLEAEDMWTCEGAERTISDGGSHLRSLPRWKKAVFRRIHASAREATRLRERGRLFQSLLFGEIRRMALALGEHLQSQDHIPHPEDVFFLHLREIEELLTGKYLFPETIPDLVELRKKSHREMNGTEAPSCFLTERGEYVSPKGSPVPRNEASTLSGIGVSPGKATGKVKVVLDPMDHGLRKGDILVAKTTDPGWTPLFFLAGGLVIEKGGMLSHGAIVAREFGIPAVVNVEGATDILKDGENVEIDGAAGTVKPALMKRKDQAPDGDARDGGR